MRVAVISDIHGNFDALSALPEDYEQLWVLGDLVNYGPQPAEVIEFVRRRAVYVVRGNHDHSIGYGEDPRCSPRFREMAEATRKYTQSVLGETDKQYLRDLPLERLVWLGAASYRLCHAVPSEPLYTYCPPGDSRWENESQRAGSDVLLVGHTHLPFQARIGRTLIVNPGSLGQPKSGDPRACYARLADGKVSLRSFQYPIESTARKIRAMPIPSPMQDELIKILRTGSTAARAEKN
jgi:putative phosphoesterase